MPIPVPTAWTFPAACLVWIACLRLSGLDRFADDKAGRLAGIEGLRGILALMVVGHHFAIARQYGQTGQWSLTPSPFWNLLGQCAVALFFMVAGLLFAQKIARSPEGLRTIPFLVGRLVRLYPVYLVVLVLVAALALFQRTGPDRPGLGDAAADVGRWLTFDMGPLLGWADAGRSVAFTPWSLQYEGVFYLSLPLFALVWSFVRFGAWMVVGLAAGSLYLVWGPANVPWLNLSTLFFAPFLLGAAVSTIPEQGRLAELMRGLPGLGLCPAALLLMFTTQRTAYALVPNLFLTLVFAPIALGNTLAGSLTRRPVQFLGAISYDIYLLHGLALYGLFTLWPQGAIVTTWIIVWAELIGIGLVAIALSLAVHRLVEVPAQRLGARLVRTNKRERLAAP